MDKEINKAIRELKDINHTLYTSGSMDKADYALTAGHLEAAKFALLRADKKHEVRLYHAEEEERQNREEQEDYGERYGANEPEIYDA